MIHPWNWRWHNSFGGGQLLDWVGHHVDIALWSLGLDGTGPVKMEGTGEKGTHEVFQHLHQIRLSKALSPMAACSRSAAISAAPSSPEKRLDPRQSRQIEASDKREMLRNVPADFDTKPPSHYQNFIDCVRSRKLTVAPAEAAHRASSFGQLAIVALDTQQRSIGIRQAEKVIDNPTQAAHPRLGARVLRFDSPAEIGKHPTTNTYYEH
jgi:predicted dehydrogenase